MNGAEKFHLLYRFLLFAAFLGFISCETVPPSSKLPSQLDKGKVQSKSPRQDSSSYHIGSGDVLVIDVWRVPLLSQEVMVRPDGTFLYPLLGSVPAEGKTVDEVRVYLTETLGKSYLVNPLVTVTRGSKSRGFFVGGEVKNPGSFQFEERINVHQAIIMAGGFTDFASKRVRIIRRKGKTREVIKANIGDLEKEGSVDPQTQIQPGDVIVVPKRWL